MKRFSPWFLLLLSMLIVKTSHAQQPGEYSSSEILQGIKKLNKLGSVLYLAAHPDDENTRLITYLSKDKLMRTGYLSLTRGDGGQNLIGTEKGAALGVLRTQELLEARNIDGGIQFFTRAVDFGYSKSADESLSKWGKDKILSDVVWIIRKFRPDVIITRFPPEDYGGHGHHIASAMLAKEAFKLAADDSAFPSQLEFVDPWQPKRLLFNASTWWNKDLPLIADTSDQYFSVDVGTYNEILGFSHNEMAMKSRSQHRSQGFGAALQRGKKLEYLKYVAGEKTNKGIMAGINTSWESVGAPSIDKKIDELLASFDSQHPSHSVPDLLEIYKAIQKVNNQHWKAIKSREVKSLIAACTGLWLEATSSEHTVAFGDTLGIRATAINRSGVEMTINEMVFPSGSVNEKVELPENQIFDYRKTVRAPHSDTNPYWLQDDYDNLYPVADQEMIGFPENPPVMEVMFKVNIQGVELNYKVPVRYKWTDKAKGELYRPLSVVPPATVNINEKVYVFAGKEAKQVELTLMAHSPSISGKVTLKAPEDWAVVPEQYDFDIEEKGKEQLLAFSVTPPKGQSVGKLKAEIKIDGESYDRGYRTIIYPHILTQTLLPPAKSKAVKIDITKRGEKIGYIMGPGDEIPQSLKQIGYKVDLLKAENLHKYELQQYHTIITGIRAYNTEKALKYNNEELLEYVKNGGTMVVQYSKNRGLVTENIGPYPFRIAYDRVTVEEAEPELLHKDHPLFNRPNKITEEDFEGWVQERGLYFADRWDEKYTPLISWNDPGEEPVKGGLLVAKYGKGAFIYTGISFFRQLPAGNPGAFKLFANIVSFHLRRDKNQK